MVLPGMDGFDDSVVRTNPLSGTSPAIRRPSGEDEVRGPAGVIPKVGGELQGAFEPFKPPETYETAKLTADEDDPDRMLMMMRQRAGLWHRLAKFIRPLNAKGFQPNDIFDATGIEPKEQAIWVTWLQCYASLKEGVKFPSEKLEYFNDEFRGAPNLSQIMYLPAAVRAEAAEGLDEPLGGRAVVIRARVVLEVPALPGHASGVGAGHAYLDATSMASASVNAPA